ncbi:MAG: hypothetical protein RLZZ268_500 [Cyanobacteriota bacterium]|jgi:hypothetical protein
MIAGFPRSPQIGRGFAQLFPSFGSRSATGSSSLGKKGPRLPFPLTG